MPLDTSRISAELNQELDQSVSLTKRELLQFIGASCAIAIGCPYDQVERVLEKTPPRTRDVQNFLADLNCFIKTGKVIDTNVSF